VSILQRSAIARQTLVVIVGLAVGALTSFGQTYLDRPFAAFCNSASAWLVAPVLLGALMATRRGAAIAGFATCMLQVIGYYATAHLRGFAAGNAILAFWTLCALVGGPLFGMAGHIWRTESRRLRGLGGTALPAAFLAEGIWLYHHVLHYESTAVLWIVVGVVLVVFSWRPVELRWLALTLPAGLVAEIVLGVVYRQSFG
jgi:hypothetical protein